MSSLRHRAQQRWAATGLAARVWWTASASVAMAAVIALGAVTLTGGSANATAKSGATSTMPAMGSTATSGGSSMSPAMTSSSVCPNVKNTTVMSNGMVMAPVPSGPPTAAQQSAADQLVANVKSSLTKYASLSAATAAGYVPATNPTGYTVHYANWQTAKSGDVLDPTNPTFLVYANTQQGPKLLGAMFLGPAPCVPGPDIGGSLTQWHAHDNLCLSSTHQVVGQTNSSGTCTTGTHNVDTYFMLHVWVEPSLAQTHQFQADLTRSELAPIITGQA
jgi:hypothetical protein